MQQASIDATTSGMPHPVHSSTLHSADITKQLALVPQFRETEVDSYFAAFECLATAWRWPRDVWPLLIQSKLYGKAQEAVAALSLEDSLNSDLMKAAILRTYELVPEAYRQRFRNHRKASSQTYVDFAREKALLFDKWSTACSATDFATRRELVLLDDFKKGVPDRMMVYLTEQKITTLSAAAVAADEYALTHKTAFPSLPGTTAASPSSSVRNNPPSKEDRDCFYCHRF